MATITHLFRAPRRRAPMEELGEANAVENSGIEGCAHARPNGKRQLLLMDRETLDVFGLAPGIVRENVTTQGLNVNELAVGQRLRIGSVELQVSLPCEPCEQIEALLPGLMEEMRGKRGTLCRVVRGGLLKRGDAIEIIDVRVAEPVPEVS